MDKKILKQLIEKHLSTRQIARSLGLAQTTIRYWLNKYNLKAKIKKYSQRKSTGKCCVCGKNIKNKNVCCGCYTKIRRYRNKKEAVRIKGNKCKKCGWVGPLAGFCFHHTKNKKFEISKIANKSWNIIVKELKKCKLLCLNCHSIEHSNVHIKFLNAVNKYQGKSF